MSLQLPFSKWINHGVVKTHLARIKTVIRLKPFDTSTSAGRSLERYRRALLSSSAAFIAQGVSIITGLVSVPLASVYLGREKYGVWLTITTILGWIALANLGGPQGLQNSLAVSSAAGDKDKARRQVSSAFWSMAFISASLLLLFLLMEPGINWQNVFRTSSAVEPSELRWSAIIAVVLALANLPLGNLKVIYNAHQASYTSSLWDVSRMVASLGALLVITQTRLGLSGWVLAVHATTLTVGFINLYWMLSHRFPHLRPSLAYASWGSLRPMCRTSLSAFAFSLSYLVVANSANIILTRFLGPDQVPSYALPALAFAMMRAVTSNAIWSLAGAYSEAGHRGDWDWIRRTHRRTRWFAVGFCAVFTVAMVTLGPWLISVWSVGRVESGRTLILLLGLYTSLSVTMGGDAILISSLERAHVLVLSGGFEAVLFISLSYWLTPILKQPGLALAAVVGYLLTQAWWCPYQVRKTLRLGEVSTPPAGLEPAMDTKLEAGVIGN